MHILQRDDYYTIWNLHERSLECVKSKAGTDHELCLDRTRFIHAPFNNQGTADNGRLVHSE